MRECAKWHPSQFRRIMQWPLRELFLAYLAILRERARQEYQTGLIVWAVQQSVSPKAVRPPDVPEILSS